MPCGDRIDEAAAAKMTDDIRNAGTAVVEAKAGKGSATLSTATAAARLVECVVKGLGGVEGCVEAAYMEMPDGTATAELMGMDYFAVPILWTKDGGSEALATRGVLTGLNAFEVGQVDIAKEALRPAIEKGVQFAADAAGKADDGKQQE